MSFHKISLFAAPILLLASCGGNGSHNENVADTSAMTDTTTVNVADSSATPNENTQQDLGLADQCITEIYRMGDPNPYTPEFAKLISDADTKAEKEGCEVGFFDINILTGSQDTGEFKTVNILGPKGDAVVAEVFGERYGLEGQGKVTVTVKLVDGLYLIDDVDGWKQKAIDYLKK